MLVPCRLPDTKKSSEIIIFPQPVCLRGQVPVKDIALLVLETPRDDDHDITFPDPCPLLDLALDPAHALNAILTADADVICPHHQFRDGKLLVQPFFGQPHTDNRCPIGIELSRAGCTFWFFYVIIN